MAKGDDKGGLQPPGGVHVIAGADEYLVSETAKKFIGDGTGLEVIDSRTASNAELQLADIARAAGSFATPPFLDPRKVTWWKNVHFLPGGGDKKATADEVKEALEQFAARLADGAATMPPNQCFVLTAPGLLKTSVFAKRLAGKAELVYFAPEKPWEAQRKAALRASEYAEESGLAFAPGAAERFVARVGADARSLKGEIEKMRTYLGDAARTITAADVDAIAAQGADVEPMPWSVTDALGTRNADQALAALVPFKGDSGYAVMMTTVIERFFRQLFDHVAATAAGKSPPAANPMTLRKNASFSRNWSRNELRCARARFFTLREQAVSGAADVETLIETEIVRACVARRR